MLTLFWLQAALTWCYQIPHCCILNCIVTESIFPCLDLQFGISQHAFSIPFSMYIKPIRHFCEKCWDTLNWSLRCYGVSCGADHTPEQNANLSQSWNLCTIEANNVITIIIDLWYVLFSYCWLFPCGADPFVELIDSPYCAIVPSADGHMLSHRTGSQCNIQGSNKRNITF